MRPLALIVALLAALASGACGAVGPPPPTTEPPTDSGIEGQALVGPMCPVMREGEPCPDQPMQATVTVLDANGAEVTQFETDAQGRFRVALPPGTYTLRPEPGPGIEHASEQVLTVGAGAFTQVTISYDSGIR